MFFVLKKRDTLIIISAVMTLLFAAAVYCAFVKPILSKLKYTSKSENKLLIMIYIEEKKLYLFEDDRCIKEFAIASGKDESPSPIGRWEIVEKYEWGEGFGGYWLGLNVVWGKYGIHGTTRENSIGRAVSNGCIRMFNKDIKELYDVVEIGTPVIIINGPFGPFGTGFRDLVPGDRGSDVRAIQQRLKELGYFKGEDNGIYEDDLKQALYSFQKDNNLKVKYTITYDDYLALGFDAME